MGLISVLYRQMFDANSVLKADADNTPVVLEVPASRILGRKAAGGIEALTGAEAAAIIGTSGGADPPWLVDIIPAAGTPVAQVGWATPLAHTSVLHGMYLLSSGANTAEASWDVLLSAGTWTVEIVYWSGADRGIASVQLDGVEVGTADFYAAAAVANSRRTVTGVVVATNGKKRLTLKMLTKNASSSAYYAYLIHVQLRRTA